MALYAASTANIGSAAEILHNDSARMVRVFNRIPTIQCDKVLLLAILTQVSGGCIPIYHVAFAAIRYNIVCKLGAVPASIEFPGK